MTGEFERCRSGQRFSRPLMFFGGSRPRESHAVGFLWSRDDDMMVVVVVVVAKKGDGKDDGAGSAI